MKESPENEIGSSFGMYVNENLAHFDRKQRTINPICNLLFHVDMAGGALRWRTLQKFCRLTAIILKV
jgi:hypothetical protein